MRRYRPHFPRLVWLVMLMVLLFSIAILVMISPARYTQPACLIFGDNGDEGGYLLRVADPTTGLTHYDNRGYPTIYDGLGERVYAPDHRAFFILSPSNYAGPDALYMGVPGSERLRLIDVQYGMSAGWSPDSSTLAYVYNGDAVYIGLLSANGTRQQGSVFSQTTFPNGAHFDGWSADGKYLSIVTIPDGLTSPDRTHLHYYFLSSTTLSLLTLHLWVRLS